MVAIDHGADVRVQPPLIYLVFLVLGILANIWHELPLLPAPLGWALGGMLIAAGAMSGQSGALTSCAAPAPQFGQTDPGLCAGRQRHRDPARSDHAL